MEKQKLAEMVMQKMKQKKELQERNRPHYQVLRLEATFAKEGNDELKLSISQLETLLGQEKKRLQQLQKHLNELENTGKKSYPRIIVKPQFIASEYVTAEIKQFYRKTANSFLRTDILRGKGYVSSMQLQAQFLKNINLMRQLQSEIRNNQSEDTKILNQKRVKVLKEDLRLRFIRLQQKKLRQTIQEEKQGNKDLLNEYQIKKVNLQSRKDRLRYVENQIELFKNKIEQAYNPLSYREHLKKIFSVEIKNEILQNSLNQAEKRMKQTDDEVKKHERILEKKTSLTVFGRVSDSPSTKLGKIRNRLENQKQTRQKMDRSLSLKFANRSNSQSSIVQSSIKKSALNLDLQNINNFSGKTSLMTTDRSSRHNRQLSSISRNLF